jgi:hypothetical protein
VGVGVEEDAGGAEGKGGRAMKWVRVQLYDVAEDHGNEWAWVNIDMIQMIVARTHVKSIPPPTTLVLRGREIRVKETPGEIFELFKIANDKEN